MKKKMRQEDRVLDYLKSHKRGITQAIAYEKYGVLRLAAVIFDLRSEGNDISTNIIEVPNRYGETCRVAQYKLVER